MLFTSALDSNCKLLILTKNPVFSKRIRDFWFNYFYRQLISNNGIVTLDTAVSISDN